MTARKLGSLLLAFAGVAALTAQALLLPSGPASAQGKGQPAQPTGGTLRVAIQQEIDSLNPFLGYNQSSTDLFRLIYPFLTTYDARDFHPEPELATDWQTSPDKLTWTFHLRPGLSWSDGQAITARDAAFTYNMITTNPAASTANGSFVANFASVAAPDDRTLVIHTKTPQATMLALDVPIVPEHVWSKVRDVGTFPNDQMPVVSGGPFTLTDYQPQQYVTLAANDRFWRGRPRIDRLRFVEFKNADAAVQALRKGEVDLAQKLTPAQYDALAGDPDIKRVNGQGRRFYELVLNPGATNSAGAPIGTGNPALRDVRVRHAIDQAIDRSVLLDKVLRGYGQVGAGYLPPVFGAWNWAPAPQQRRTFDPAAANRELDQAGYPRGPDGIRHTPQGQPLNFDFLLHGSDAADAQVGEFVQRWLHGIGINVRLEPVSDNQLNDRATGGAFDMVISGYTVNADPDYVLQLQTCAARPGPNGGGQPDSFLCDQRYDDLYRAQSSEFNPAKRIAEVRLAQQRFYEQAAGLILYYSSSLEAYRSDRFVDFPRQPAANGVIAGQQGYWSYWAAEPTKAATTAAAVAQYETAAWAIVGVVLFVGVLVALVVVRRRATVDQRE